MSERVEKLEFADVDVNELKEYPENPRVGNVEKIAESLETNGQYRPIVVNKKNNQILAGNHTWLAAKSLGWEKIAVSYVDVDEDTAKKIVLVDNRVNDLAEYNAETMTTMLNDLMDLGELVGTGFNADEVDDLLASYDSISETEFEEFQGGYAMSDEEIEEVKERRKENKRIEDGDRFHDILLYFKTDEYNEYKEMINELASHFATNLTDANLQSVRYAYENLIEKKNE